MFKQTALAIALTSLASGAIAIPLTYEFQLKDYLNDSSVERGEDNTVLNWYEEDFGSSGMTMQITVDDGTDVVKSGYNVSDVQSISVTANGLNDNNQIFSQTWTSADRTLLKANGTNIFQVDGNGIASLDYTGQTYGNPERQELVLGNFDQYNESTRTGYFDFVRLGLTSGRYIFSAGDGPFAPYVSVASTEPDQVITSVAGAAAGQSLASSSLSESLDTATTSTPIEDLGWNVEAGSADADAGVADGGDGALAFGLTTGSEISIERELLVPDTGTMNITFDYRFASGVGDLTVLLGDDEDNLQQLDLLSATGVMSDFVTTSILGIDLSNFDTTPLLRFTFFDDEAGKTLFLRDIDVTFAASQTVIQAFENSRLVTVPNPAPLALLSIGAIALLRRK